MTTKKGEGDVTASGMKTGRLSIEEIEFIQEHSKVQSAKWIADQLKRQKKVVTKYMATLANTTEKTSLISAEKNRLKYELRTRAYWSELEKRFTPEELRLCEYHWINLVEQFQSDITHSEEMAIVDVLSLDTLISRNLTERKNADTEIQRFASSLEKMYEIPDDVKTRDDIANIMNAEVQLASMRASNSSRTGEYEKLLSKKNDILKGLKSNREQRLVHVQSNKQTFFDWLKIHGEDAKRKAESHEMALLKIAVEVEKDRLTQIHIYGDNKADIPILNSDTVDNYFDSINNNRLEVENNGV